MSPDPWKPLLTALGGLVLFVAVLVLMIWAYGQPI